MSGVDIDADHHGLVSLVFFLQCGSELEGVSRHHTVIMVTGGDQGGRVIDAFPDVMQGGIIQQVMELRGVFAGTIVAFPGPADRKLVIAQHVEHTDRRQSDAK